MSERAGQGAVVSASQATAVGHNVTMSAGTIDVWMQHPTLRHSNHEMFASLRRWMGMEAGFEEALPLELTYAAHRYPAELVEYMKGRGRTKVLFGTNYPMMTADRALARLDDLGLDDDATRAFLHDNAQRIFCL